MNALRDVHRARFGAPTGARVEKNGPVAVIRNAACGTETRLTRLTEKALP